MYPLNFKLLLKKGYFNRDFNRDFNLYVKTSTIPKFKYTTTPLIIPSHPDHRLTRSYTQKNGLSCSIDEFNQLKKIRQDLKARGANRRKDGLEKLRVIRLLHFWLHH